MSNYQDYTNYKIVTKLKQVKRIIRYCKETGYCSNDFETNELHPTHPDFIPTILGISFQPGFGYIIPLGHYEAETDYDWVEVLRLLSEELIQNPAIVKVAHNLKFEYLIWKRYGSDSSRGILFDTMLAKHLLDENSFNGLKDLVTRFLPEYGDYEQDVKHLVRKHKGYHNVPLEPLAKYCALDCDLTLRLALFFEQRLIKTKLYGLFRNLSMMQTRVLGDLEYDGMLVDRDYLRTLRATYQRKIADTENSLRTHPQLYKYDVKRLRKAKKDLTLDIKADIADLKAEQANADEKESNSIQRKINNRYTKLSNIQAGQLTKNEAKQLEPFNFNSPKQLIDLFYESKFGFKFKVIDYTKDKNKQETDTPSTAEETLIKLKAFDKTSFIDNLLEFRALVKLYSTYVQGIWERIDDNDRIHGSYLIHGTVTGRLSSRNPNMQNIPRGTTAADIKRMFVPPPGYLMMEVDYSQAELRVVAELADDTAMIDIFKRGYNIHTATGLKINKRFHEYDLANEARKDETHPQHIEFKKIHKQGKVTNFSILYGQSDWETAEALGVSKEEAGKFKKEWFNQFPGVKKYIDNMYKSLKKTGYVKNIFGRKRRLPGIYSSEFGVVNKAKRDAVNAPIQGAASDFTQLAFVVVWEKLRAGEFKYKDLIPCYTVHDSIGFYIKPSKVHHYAPKIVAIGSNPDTQDFFGFAMTKVDMKLSVEVGVCWSELHEYKPDADYRTWDLINN